MFGHHLSIEVTQVPIRIRLSFHKMIARENTRPMKAFFSSRQLFTCCLVNMTGHQLLIDMFCIPIRRLTCFYITVTRNIFLPMSTLLRIANRLTCFLINEACFHLFIIVRGYHTINLSFHKTIIWEVTFWMRAFFCLRQLFQGIFIKITCRLLAIQMTTVTIRIHACFHIYIIRNLTFFGQAFFHR